MIINPHKETNLYQLLDLLCHIRPKTILDVGAAEGALWLYYREHETFQDARYVFIDCMAENLPIYDMMRDSFGTDHMIGAAGNDSGTTVIRVDAHPYWTQRDDMPGPGYHTHEMRTVPCFRLDQMVMERGYHPPYFLRLDVQGAESLVLSGVDGIVADIPLLTLEISVLQEPFLTSAIWAWLREHDYYIYGLINIDCGTLSNRMTTFYVVAVKKPLLPDETFLIRREESAQQQTRIDQNQAIFHALLGQRP